MDVYKHLNAVHTKAEEYLKGSPRIKFRVDNIYEISGKYKGVELVMWYIPQHDDEREVSQDNLSTRIARLTKSEAATLGKIAQQIGDHFPKCELTLAHEKEGRLEYYLIPR